MYEKRNILYCLVCGAHFETEAIASAKHCGCELSYINFDPDTEKEEAHEILKKNFAEKDIFPKESS